MARALPLTSVLNKCLIACSRDATVSCSFWTIPFEFFTVIAALSLPHSILPSQRQAGAMSRKSLANFVQAGFLAAGTRVEHENFHMLIGQFSFFHATVWVTLESA